MVALPLQATVRAPLSSTPFQVQFWSFDWLRWISCTVSPVGLVNRTVGRTPLSYWWLPDQLISPSASRCPTRCQSVVAVSDWCTSTSQPLSLRVTAGVVPVS